MICVIFTRRLWAEIDMDAAIRNYHAIKNKIGEVKQIHIVINTDQLGQRNMLEIVLENTS